MRRLLGFFLLTALSTTLSAQAPGPTALVNCTIHTISDGVIENAALVIRDGKIDALGASLDVPSDAATFDCAGDHVYPGFIDAGSDLGLVEIDSVEETEDNNELGQVRPHMRALTAVNPNTVHVPTTRVSGVTNTLTVPAGTYFPGTAALIRLHGYTPEQMAVGFEAVVLAFPTLGRRGTNDRRSEERLRRDDREALDQLDEVWTRAKLFARIDSAYRADPDPARLPDYNPAMQAMLPVVRGEMPLLVQVDAADEIRAAIEWVEEHDVRAIFSGVDEGWRVADKLAEAGIPCIVGPVLALPSRGYDRYDKPYANAGLLVEAGVQIAFRTGPSSSAPSGRNLPYHAGFAVAYGLDHDAALRALTLDAAAIFGVSDRIGSLEPGKDATLFIADGDPLEPSTTVRQVYIGGYEIPMTDRQRELYEEFLNRSPGLRR